MLNALGLLLILLSFPISIAAALIFDDNFWAGRYPDNRIDIPSILCVLSTILLGGTGIYIMLL